MASPVEDVASGPAIIVASDRTQGHRLSEGSRADTTHNHTRSPRFLRTSDHLGSVAAPPFSARVGQSASALLEGSVESGILSRSIPAPRGARPGCPEGDPRFLRGSAPPSLPPQLQLPARPDPPGSTFKSWTEQAADEPVGDHVSTGDTHSWRHARVLACVPSNTLRGVLVRAER
jgi:hypothetical protein